MFLTMGITLYTTRLILNALGSTDYGIFNLVAGVIAMLSFLNNAMATSTQRFLSYYQGKKDVPMQRQVFNNSLILHLIIGVALVILLEVGGIYLFDQFLNIPSSRLDSARSIYHFMSGTVFFTVLTVPFTGSLVARENMLWVAVVNISETLLRLAIALYLINAAGDKLMLYGMLTALVSVISFMLYAIYCYQKYPECSVSRTSFHTDRNLLQQLTSFAGWNLFGSLCAVGRNQGLAVLLNLSFGAVINAAYGIAIQVSGQLAFFSSTLLRAINPQIMKSEGALDRSRMLRLSMIASKFSYFLLAFIAVPCIFEMHTILEFWLKNVPDHTVVFCQLTLIGSLTNQLTIGLQSGIQAVGKIKAYQAVVGTVILMNIPMAYLLFKLGYPPYFALVSFIGIEFIACCLRLYFLHKVGGLKISSFFNTVIINELIPTLTLILTCYLMVNHVEMDYRFIATIIVSTLIFIPSVYITGLSPEEKKMVKNLIFKLTSKLNPGKKIALDKI